MCTKLSFMTVLQEDGQTTKHLSLYDQQSHNSNSKVSQVFGSNLPHNLSCPGHISRVTGKSNSILAFLLRNLYYCPKGLKAKAYLTCVHPIVEYAGNSLHAYCTHAVSHSLKKSSQICFQ